MICPFFRNEGTMPHNQQKIWSLISSSLDTKEIAVIFYGQKVNIFFINIQDCKILWNYIINKAILSQNGGIFRVILTSYILDSKNLN